MQYLPKRATLVGNVAIHCIELRMVPHVGRNSICHRSVNLVSLEKLKSQLLIPGPQQIDPRALPIVTRCNCGICEQIRIESTTRNGLTIG
jgi:hypothetical protein